MNLIDLRNFEYELNKIILFENSEFIFSNTECEDGVFKRYFYKYDMNNKHINKINKIGIDTCETACYNDCIFNNYIYTNSYKVQGDEAETSIYKVSLINGEIDRLYTIHKEVSVIFLSERYVVLRGTNFEIDEEHSDIYKDIYGEYDYAILCDLTDKKEYEIRDKRIILGIRDYFIPYIVKGRRYIVFEEAYMEDWELEEMFIQEINKENIYRNGYRKY